VPTDVLFLVATAFLAVVALGAAVVAVRSARRSPAEPVTEPAPAEPVRRSGVLVPIENERPIQLSRPESLAPRAVQGRVLVPPSEQQVVNTALGRPYVRLSILAHGLAHALRPESRDRIVALMRREYRRRRRERLRAGRRAIRAAMPVSAEEWTEQPWIAELPPSPSEPVRSDARQEVRS
jgi:hypothetical protein